MSNDFYVSLPSTARKNEFPDNKSNSFKVRLPHPIRLVGSGWKVGLSSISMPDANIDLTRFENLESPLLSASWTLQRKIKSEEEEGKFINEIKQLSTNLTFEDILFDNNIVDGLSFMKALIFKFDQILNYNRDHGDLTQDPDSQKKLEYFFKWESDELVLDNSEIDPRYAEDLYEMAFNEKLAFDMGWLRKKDNGLITIGPNMKEECPYPKIPKPKDMDGDKFWEVKEGKLFLSNFCNWRFVNFSRAFENVIKETSRALFVSSDVGGSSVVGDQVTDLLREIHFRREGKGLVYFEPLHIQYISVRNHMIDIIESQVSEVDGQLADFSEGRTVLTLHFKRE